MLSWHEILNVSLSHVHTDDELDPLVRVAETDDQFEAIHPFQDGNGRPAA